MPDAHWLYEHIQVGQLFPADGDDGVGTKLIRGPAHRSAETSIDRPTLVEEPLPQSQRTLRQIGDTKDLRKDELSLKGNAFDGRSLGFRVREQGHGVAKLSEG